ncbi:homeobox protein 5-like [Condylostylus longicornis]|uniref:homeobox protein 5-like n=1 Tax=Condylostylus longicornis TaxID=2530218 RepID=UPI00244DF7BE|nr:homeobox protein 5-like [Condylostylus longicornis]
MKIRHNHMLYLPTTIMLFTLWVIIKPVAVSTTNGNSGGSSGSSTFNTGRRKKSGGSDSILEMMDSKKIEKFFEEKRFNMSLAASRSSPTLNENNPIIIENDLNEEFIENSSPSSSLFHHNQHQHKQRQHGNTGNNGVRNDRYKIHNRRRQHLIERHHDDFDYDTTAYDTTVANSQRKKHHNSDNLQMDQLLPYNDTLLPTDSTVSLDTIDSKQFSVDQILKTTNDGVYLTKKEFLQKDWCKTEPLIQRIRESGCISRPFVNHFCYGQCNSFFIPKEPKETKRRKHNRRKHGNRNNVHHNNNGNNNNGNNNNNGVITNNNNSTNSNGSIVSSLAQAGYLEDEDLTIPQFESCGFCKPKKFIWVTITLRCPSMVPHIRKKRIQKIKRCSCMAMPMEKY